MTEIDIRLDPLRHRLGRLRGDQLILRDAPRIGRGIAERLGLMGRIADRLGAVDRNRLGPDGRHRGGDTGELALHHGIEALGRAVGLDLADRVFQRQPLARDVLFGKRRIHAAQLCNQGRSRAVIDRAACLASVLRQSRDGPGDQGRVIGHCVMLCRLP
ncbi:hypothetical protein E8M01_04735 [Phreatobacter stygius]|uniref:Uncharacterized protein n=1 Tax=Phreatobacter stygius TaxID=1940610 RepID=A0A4D7AQP2_9HYPH|nr:hypothetical protein E8M01_04735 [Phreatobacter stygius]